jgi:hypothetical protein
MSARSHILPSVSTGNFESINTPFTWKYKVHHITKMHQATKYNVPNFSHTIFHVIHKLFLLVYICEHTHTNCNHLILFTLIRGHGKYTHAGIFSYINVGVWLYVKSLL